MKKISFLILFITINNFSNAQALPSYSMHLNKKNRFSLERAINFGLPVVSLSPLVGILTKKIYPEHIAMNPIDFGEEVEEIFVEELAPSLKLTTFAFVSSIGISFVLVLYYPAIKHFYTDGEILKTKSIEYKYTILDDKAQEVCSGSKKSDFKAILITNPIVSMLAWKEIVRECDYRIEFGKPYFVNVVNSSGKLVIKGQKVIPLE